MAEVQSTSWTSIAARINATAARIGMKGGPGSGPQAGGGRQEKINAALRLHDDLKTDPIRSGWIASASQEKAHLNKLDRLYETVQRIPIRDSPTENDIIERQRLLDNARSEIDNAFGQQAEGKDFSLAADSALSILHNFINAHTKAVQAIKATPSFSAYVWNPYSRKFINVGPGKPVDTSKARQIVAEVRGAVNGRLNKLAKDLQSGELQNTAQFAIDFRSEIKNLYITQTVIARGGIDQMEASEWGQLGAALKDQYGYINNLVRDIENANIGVRDEEGEIIVRDSGIPELGDDFLNRVDMYTESAWGARGEFENVVRDREQELGSLEGRELGDSKESCAGCIAQADLGLQPPGVLLDIGDTECQLGCNCRFYFENAELEAAAEAFGGEVENPDDAKGLKGGPGSGPHPSGRAELAAATYVPMTKEKLAVAKASEAKVAKLIGGAVSSNNKAFDIIKDKYAVEVKTIVAGKNPKITMHPESLARKVSEANINKYKTSTVVIDKRAGRTDYYFKASLGSFRLSAMEKLNSSALRAKYT